MTEKVMDVYLRTVSGYTVREEVRDSVMYKVVPVTMMVEGVHSGSHGPVLHLASELGHMPDSWNGIPITYYHPQVGDEFVSANHPDVLPRVKLGRVFNTFMENNQLKGEAWIDVNRTRQIAPEVLARINAGLPMEVSVGVLTDEEPLQGYWNNEQYQSISRNPRPDHLALLPDETGACSLADGCGIRVNTKGGTNVTEKSVLLQTMKGLSEEGYTISVIANLEGYRAIVDKVRGKLDSMDTEQQVYFLEEVYPTHVIYRVRNRTNDTTEMFQQTYQSNADGTVEFVGNALKVQKQVEYSVITNTEGGDTPPDAGTDTPPETTPATPETAPGGKIKRVRKKVTTNQQVMAEKCTPCVQKKVDTLISNSATGYTETHREWLEGLEESQLDLMAPATPEAAPAPQVNTAELSNERIMQAVRESVATADDFINLAPADMRDSMRSGLQLHTAARTAKIEKIVAYTKQWTKEELEAMDSDMLDKLSGMIKPTTYTGQVSGSNVQTNADETTEEVLLPTGVVLKD